MPHYGTIIWRDRASECKSVNEEQFDVLSFLLIEVFVHRCILYCNNPTKSSTKEAHKIADADIFFMITWAYYQCWWSS